MDRDGVVLEAHAGLARVHGEVFVGHKLPGLAVARSVDLDFCGRQYPVEGILHEAHADLAEVDGAAEVEDDVNAVAPVALPVAVGVGGVAAQLAVDEGVVSSTRVDGLIGAVLCAQRYLGAHAGVAQQILLADHAFAVLVVTDGLDGLAIGNIIIAALTLAVFSYLIGHSHISSYLKVPYVAGAGEISVFLTALFGSGLGFLWYNSYPAEIFMGDTGSLCLGGLLGLSAVFIKQELILFIVGGIFVAEALSVMIQVSVFKRTQKRVFRMAPLHHHFELGGLAETKVTIRFWIVSIILAIIAISSLKLR